MRRRALALTLTLLILLTAAGLVAGGAAPCFDGTDYDLCVAGPIRHVCLTDDVGGDDVQTPIRRLSDVSRLLAKSRDRPRTLISPATESEPSELVKFLFSKEVYDNNNPGECVASGCLSVHRGVLPTQWLPGAFPEGSQYHEVWDHCLLEVPGWIRSGQAKERLRAMQVLSAGPCDDDQSTDGECLPDRYVERAHGVLSYLTAVYMYFDTTVFQPEPSADPDIDIPPSLAKPMSQVRTRTKRGAGHDDSLPNHTFSWVDMFTNNVASMDKEVDDLYPSPRGGEDTHLLVWEDFKMAFGFVSNECERRFVGITVKQSAMFGVVIRHLRGLAERFQSVDVENRLWYKHVSKKDIVAIAEDLESIASAIEEMSLVFTEMNDKNCDPAVWWDQVAVWAQAPKPNSGPNGLQFVPVIVMDALLKRQVSTSDLGQQVGQNMEALLPNHRRLIELVQQELDLPRAVDGLSQSILEATDEWSGVEHRKWLYRIQRGYNKVVRAHRRWCDQHMTKASHFIEIGMRESKRPRGTSGGTFRPPADEGKTSSPRMVNHGGGGDTYLTSKDVHFEKRAVLKQRDGMGSLGEQRCPAPAQDPRTTSLVSMLKQSASERSFSHIEPLYPVRYTAVPATDEGGRGTLKVTLTFPHFLRVKIKEGAIIKVYPSAHKATIEETIETMSRAENDDIELGPEWLQVLLSMREGGSWSGLSSLLSKRSTMNGNGYDELGTFGVPSRALVSVMQNHPLVEDWAIILAQQFENAGSEDCRAEVMDLNNKVVTFKEAMRGLPAECRDLVGLQDAAYPISPRRFSVVEVYDNADNDQVAIFVMGLVRYKAPSGHDQTGMLSQMLGEMSEGVIYVAPTTMVEDGPVSTVIGSILKERNAVRKEKSLAFEKLAANSLRLVHMQACEREDWSLLSDTLKPKMSPLDSIFVEELGKLLGPCNAALSPQKSHGISNLFSSPNMFPVTFDYSSGSYRLFGSRKLESLARYFKKQSPQYESLTTYLKSKGIDHLGPNLANIVLVDELLGWFGYDHEGIREACLALPDRVKPGNAARCLWPVHTGSNYLALMGALRTMLFHLFNILAQSELNLELSGKYKYLLYLHLFHKHTGVTVAESHDHLESALSEICRLTDHRSDGFMLQPPGATSLTRGSIQNHLLGSRYRVSILSSHDYESWSEDRQLTQIIKKRQMTVIFKESIPKVVTIFATGSTWPIFRPLLHYKNTKHRMLRPILVILAKSWDSVVYKKELLNALKPKTNRDLSGFALVLVLSRSREGDCIAARKALASTKQDILLQGYEMHPSSHQVFCNPMGKRGFEYMHHSLKFIDAFQMLPKNNHRDQLEATSEGPEWRRSDDEGDGMLVRLSSPHVVMVVGSARFGDAVRRSFVALSSEKYSVRHARKDSSHSMAVAHLAMLRRSGSWVEEVYSPRVVGAEKGTKSDDGVGWSSLTCEQMATLNEKYEEACLVSWNGDIFDIGSYLPHHPGSDDALQSKCGKDITDAFYAIGHSIAASRIIDKYKIGTLSKAEVGSTADIHLFSDCETAIIFGSLSITNQDMDEVATNAMLHVSEAGVLYLASLEYNKQRRGHLDIAIPLVREVDLGSVFAAPEVQSIIINVDTSVLNFKPNFDDYQLPPGASHEDTLHDFVRSVQQCMVGSPGRSIVDKRVMDTFMGIDNWSGEMLPDLRLKLAKCSVLERGILADISLYDCSIFLDQRDRHRSCVFTTSQVMTEALVNPNVILADHLHYCRASVKKGFFSKLSSKLWKRNRIDFNEDDCIAVVSSVQKFLSHTCPDKSKECYDLAIGILGQPFSGKEKIWGAYLMKFARERSRDVETLWYSVRRALGECMDVVQEVRPPGSVIFIPWEGGSSLWQLLLQARPELRKSSDASSEHSDYGDEYSDEDYEGDDEGADEGDDDDDAGGVELPTMFDTLQPLMVGMLTPEDRVNVLAKTLLEAQ